jgi:hypothetical protein
MRYWIAFYGLCMAGAYLSGACGIVAAETSYRLAAMAASVVGMGIGIAGIRMDLRRWKAAYRAAVSKLCLR